MTARPIPHRNIHVSLDTKRPRSLTQGLRCPVTAHGCRYGIATCNVYPSVRLKGRRLIGLNRPSCHEEAVNTRSMLKIRSLLGPDLPNTDHRRNATN